ncbi:PorT family protein [Reichenbachiella carrageenanivorans]|uniref:PorT family protein n=1 Tax=Reichenbachiella carrageenanivorans TaxID=2979869 RepID=A0ABY6CV26_9BACT|nr:porin family protein [Reichenbachiella carrageenanivorans]UXX77723.1 PorT family protein [Reichenbachiella carrageenanivorans]
MKIMKTTHQKTAYTFCLYVLLILCSHLTFAQKPQKENSNCVSEAEQSYRSGQIEDIRSKLPACLENSRVTAETRIRGYRLLAITYLYFNENQEAEKYMKLLLKMDPEYKVDENQDPPEFIQLYGTFRTKPILLFGLHVGLNSSFVHVQNNYSLDNTSTSLGKYSSGIGITGGISVEFAIWDHLSLITGLDYQTTQYEYQKEQFGYSTLDYLEKSTWVGLPVGAKFYITNSKFRLYTQATLSFQYLLSANATPSRSDNMGEILGNQTVVGPSIDILAQREKLNMLIDFGLGFNWKGIVGPGYFTGLISYSYGLINVANPTTRFDNTELIYDYNYVSNDFSLNSFSLKLGYAIPIYKPKVLKRKTN